jgi:phage-related protein
MISGRIPNRAIYTAQFAGIIYVLHAFQKKSKKGIETPARETELIRQRLKLARADFDRRKSSRDEP